jgi:putative nucleotidyltransferase with HDIG domain
MTIDDLVRDLRKLAAETYLLWEPGWVTFNWREYTYDHVERAVALASGLAGPESADADIVRLAALLHDITKSYDGDYVTDDAGQRVVDGNGNWHNLLRPPVGQNKVTALFDALSLSGQMHNESGAAVASELLRQYGLDDSTRLRVMATIRDHLAPPADAPAESLCLYDADTIDANIGLPAFVRNMYINLHFFELRNPGACALDETLRKAPLDYLRPYVTEKLKPWAQGKMRDFVPKLRTASARQLALARLGRLDKTFSDLAAELDEPVPPLHQGRLAVVLHYMRHREGASIAAETRYLSSEWLTQDGVTPGARALVAAVARECAGLD